MVAQSLDLSLSTLRSAGDVTRVRDCTAAAHTDGTGASVRFRDKRTAANWCSDSDIAITLDMAVQHLLCDPLLRSMLKSAYNKVDSIYYQNSLLCQFCVVFSLSLCLCMKVKPSRSGGRDGPQRAEHLLETGNLGMRYSSAHTSLLHHDGPRCADHWLICWLRAQRLLAFLPVLASWLRAGPPMLNATQPTTGRKRVAMMPTRLSPAQQLMLSPSGGDHTHCLICVACTCHTAARMLPMVLRKSVLLSVLHMINAPSTRVQLQEIMHRQIIR